MVLKLSSIFISVTDQKPTWGSYYISRLTFWEKIDFQKNDELYSSSNSQNLEAFKNILYHHIFQY